jgi:CheY-like chemotaxis protein
MLQEIIEPAWLDAFEAVLGRCALKKGDTVAILAETQSRPVLPLLARALLATGKSKPVIERFEGARLDDAAAASDLKTSVALAYGSLGDRERSMEAGMNDYLTKPVETARLAAVLRQWLGVPVASDPLATDQAAATPARST